MVNSRMFYSDVQVTLPRTHAWISKRQEHEFSKSHNEVPCVVVGWLSYPMEKKPKTHINYDPDTADRGDSGTAIATSKQ